MLCAGLLCAVAGCQAPQWDRQASLNAHRLTTHRPQQNHLAPANQQDAGIKGNAGRSRSGYRLIVLLQGMGIAEACDSGFLACLGSYACPFFTCPFFTCPFFTGGHNRGKEAANASEIQWSEGKGVRYLFYSLPSKKGYLSKKSS